MRERQRERERERERGREGGREKEEEEREREREEEERGRERQRGLTNLMSLNNRAFSRLSNKAIRKSAKSFILPLFLYCGGERTINQLCTPSKY